MKQVRKLLGKVLKEARERLQMPQDVTIEYLKDLGINCSKPNLSKIERDLITCRADILGGLCSIYEISADEILFEDKKKLKAKKIH